MGTSHKLSSEQINSQWLEVPAILACLHDITGTEQERSLANWGKMQTQLDATVLTLAESPVTLGRDASQRLAADIAANPGRTSIFLSSAMRMAERVPAVQQKTYWNNMRAVVYGGGFHSPLLGPVDQQRELLARV